ncbi:MAG: elongation factor Ts [Mycoplasma sp.]|nr:elongation factor Ts [Mycoplasma sp.]
MSNIVTPQKVKELRDRTQAGYMDCKQALEETKGDVEKAILFLREKGIAKAAKKAGAIASEGTTDVVEKDGLCLLIEVNSQTDFVAKNDEFKKYVKDIESAILKNKSTKDVGKMKLGNGETVDSVAINLTAKIGEKISFRRAELIKKENNQQIGIYRHANERISAAVVIEGKVKPEILKNVAMHVAAMAPKFLDEKQVDKEWLENEKKILIAKTIDEGKPKEFAEKIVAGRIKKILEEACLIDQPFFKDPSVTIGKYVKDNGGSLVKMIRFELGEGIEKVQTDFASEVASQMKK